VGYAVKRKNVKERKLSQDVAKISIMKMIHMLGA